MAVSFILIFGIIFKSSTFIGLLFNIYFKLIYETPNPIPIASFIGACSLKLHLKVCKSFIFNYFDTKFIDQKK